MFEIDRVARSQWGLLTHDQAIQVLSRRQLGRALVTGRLISEHRGVYRVAGSPASWQQRLVAATLALHGAVASHQSAARLHDLKVAVDEMPHVTIGAKRAAVRRNVTLHRSLLVDSEVVVRQRIACTSVERTLIDLACVLSQSELRTAMEEAVVLGKSSFVAMRSALDVCGSQGRKGLVVFKRVLYEHLPVVEGTKSAIEAKVAKASRLAGLPIPQKQYPVATKLGFYSIDLAWPDRMLGAEADGYNVHTASRIRHTLDRRRRNELETMGWSILNFTHDMKVAEIAAVLRANNRAV